METENTQTLADLRRNDPSVIAIYIYLDLTNIPNHGAATTLSKSLSEALKANNFVKTVHLLVSAKWTRLEQWTPLFLVLQAGQAGGNIVNISLNGMSGLRHQSSDPELLMATTSSILQKLQGIPSMQGLTLLVPVFSDALTSFLDVAPPNFEILYFGSLHFVVSNIPSFAAAVERRHQVKSLTLMLPCSSVSLELLQSLSAQISPNLCILTGVFRVEHDDSLAQMLGALTKVKSIDLLAFDAVQSQAVVHDLTKFLHAIKLTKLRLHINETREWTSVLETKRTLLVALESNFTIHRENISADDVVDFFDHEQRGKIMAYTQRNVGLHGWVQRPQSVPQHLWPEALCLAVRSGHDQLFRSLLSIAAKL